jgi:hypothetical protein
MKKDISYYDKPFSKWTTAQLIKEAKELDYMIYVVECYGTSDMTELMGINKELSKRGVEIEYTK